MQTLLFWATLPIATGQDETVKRPITDDSDYTRECNQLATFPLSYLQ